MTVYVVQTEYYGWITGVFMSLNAAKEHVAETASKYPKDRLLVREEKVLDVVEVKA